MEKRTMTHAEWTAEARRRFGDNSNKWRFVCPVCKHEASVEDWRNADAPDPAIAFSCIGRWLGKSRDAFQSTGKGPCNYAGGGLFKLNPVVVDGFPVFDFAPATEDGG
jgi:hypothetical protein